MTLRRCPCGKVPTGFEILENKSVAVKSYFYQRYAKIAANCCLEYSIEGHFPHSFTENDLRAYAEKVWNDMPMEGE